MGCGRESDTKQANEEANALSYKGKSLADWIAQLQDKDTWTRIKAAQALVEFSNRDEQPPEAVLCALAQALRDKDSTVRFVASASFDGSPFVRYRKHAVPLLVDALKDKDANVRRDAARYLGDCGGREQSESIVPALGEALLKDQDAEVRRTAAFALGRIGKPAVPVLIRR
jgi:HEAT repeat protein